MALQQFCPRCKTNRGRPPAITGCALDEDRTKRLKPWLPLSEEPDNDTVRRMFTEAMKVVLSFIMENHLYMFDGQIKLQSDRLTTYWCSCSVVHGMVGLAVQNQDG